LATFTGGNINIPHRINPSTSDGILTHWKPSCFRYCFPNRSYQSDLSTYHLITWGEIAIGSVDNYLYLLIRSPILARSKCSNAPHGQQSNKILAAHVVCGPLIDNNNIDRIFK